MANPVLNARTFTAATPRWPQAQPPAPPGQPWAGQPFGPPTYTAGPAQSAAGPYGPSPAQPDSGPYGYGPGQPAAGPYTYGPTQGQPGYGQPAPQGQFSPPGGAPTGLMTVDSVLTKTALTIGLMVVVAALSWRLSMEILVPAAIIAGLVAIICPLVVAFRRAIGPVLAFVFAGLEGLMLGGISKLFEIYYPGIVFQAVIGTFAAAAATLAAYHFGKVRLTGKIRRILFISLIAFAGVALLNLILSLVGINLGFYAGVTGPVTTWAWLWAGVGVVLGVVSLIDDFQFIDEGIRAGAPDRQSWIAAYGLTVTMVYLYTHILRILSYLRR